MIFYVKKFDYFDKDLLLLLTNNNIDFNINSKNITVIRSSISISTSKSTSLSSTTVSIPSSISNVILATSAFKKRKYLDDYKDFKEAFYIESIILQIAKGLITGGSVPLLEYTQHLEKQLEAEKEGREIDDYDWDDKIDMFTNKCIESCIRFVSVSWIKKSYELYAALYIDHRIADKLTKDVKKSLIRKMSRMSKFNACTKIIKTNLNASAISSISAFTFDIIYDIYQTVVYKKQFSLEKTTILVFKRCGFYIILSLGSAVGFSVGSFIAGPNVGGLIGSIFGELGGQLLSNTLIKNET